MTTENSVFPGTESLYDVLAEFRGARAYIVPMVDSGGRALGNNGDALMHWVFDQILIDLGIIRASKGDADIVIVPPNGALLEVYRFPWILRDDIGSLRALPLVIFPSSSLFETVDPAFMFEGRTARTIWILREANSYEKLVAKWGASLESVGVDLVLDHDVVASGHRFVPRLFSSARQPQGRRLLVGARTDVEARPVPASSGPSSQSAPMSLSRRVFFRLPLRLRVFIARRVFKDRLHGAGQALLERASEGGVVVSPADYATQVYADISAVEYADFRSYIDEISRATTVVTDRLHIALPAAILGKEVVLVEAGYHKLRGVYNRSLTRADNVRLVLPDASA